MTQPTAPSDLARVTADEFARYFRHLAARVEQAALARHRGAALDQAVSVRQQHRPPGPAPDRQPESLHRGPDRRHRLRPPSRARVHRPGAAIPRDEVLARFHQAVDLVVRTLESQDESAFADPGRRPAADPDSPRPVPRLRRSHEQPHRPDELPGAGAQSTKTAGGDRATSTCMRSSDPCVQLTAC